ncbi:MAG: hypothetical protein EA356_15355 [Geminicoccaceae bacterium]|nr:MAG: hypothetical protein EA356_15355 [Geminicoccaceae bacterium]
MAALERLFDARTWRAGQSYHWRGLVREVAATAEGAVTGVVDGRAARPYVQNIRVRHDAAGQVIGVNGLCTCPVGRNCKHVAAVLIAFAAASGEPGPKVPPATSGRRPAVKPKVPNLPPEVVRWLAAVKAADAPAAIASDDYPPNIRDRLLYVLGLTPRGQVALRPWKISLKKDGTPSKTAKAYEAAWIGRQDAPGFVRPVDGRILFRRITLGLNPSPYGGAPPPVATGEVFDLVRLVAATERGRLGSIEGPVLRLGEPRRGRLEWQVQDDGSQLPLVQDKGGTPLVALPLDPLLYMDLASGEVGELTLDVPGRMAQLLLQAPPVPPEAADRVAEVLGGLQAGPAPIPRSMRAELRTDVTPTPRLRLLGLQATRRFAYGSGKTLPVLRLAFDYAGHGVEAFPYIDPIFKDGDRVVTVERDRDAEHRAHERLLAFGAERLDRVTYLERPRGSAPLDHAFVTVPADARVELDRAAERRALDFTAKTVPALRKEGWQVEIDPSWPYRTVEEPVDLQAGLRGDDRTGLALGVTLQVGERRFEMAPLVSSIIEALPWTGEGELPEGFDLAAFLGEARIYPELEDGRFVPLPSERLAPLVEAFLAVHDAFRGFHPAEAARIATLAEALEGAGIAFEGGEALLELGRRLQALADAPMADPPPGLDAELRPYQRTGYGWLSAVTATGFGGVLADDMGLGKTVQTLALLVERHVAQTNDRPSLLIAPTSLVGTWRREAERFAPKLKVLTLHGAKRHGRVDDIQAHHLVITTYPLLPRDHRFLQAQQWDLVVLDEAQAVKNPATQAAKHIRKLEANARLALSGTPVENDLGDLWSLFDWLIPGLLGDRKAFTARFRHPIERKGDRAAQARLNARLRPFVLRRTKQDVLADLPPKTEITELVTLGEKQRALYETIRATMDERVRATIAAKGLAASRITILDALLKLRQVCCDPALLPASKSPKLTESAKRDRLMEMLDDLVAQGRRVLVFSQFVAMLRLIEQDVKARGWDYAWLTGDTKDREAAVRTFQEGNAPLFLISLKAGGVGLTLTAADTVILYDPWWNPAVERQAMDRAHRIGQDQPVFVYRLVAEGAVEEAISALQTKKQALADALFEGPAEGPLALTEDDLANLFKPLAAG